MASLISLPMKMPACCRKEAIRLMPDLSRPETMEVRPCSPDSRLTMKPLFSGHRGTSHQTMLLNHEMRSFGIVACDGALQIDQTAESQFDDACGADRQMRDGAIQRRPLLKHAVQHEAGKARQFPCPCPVAFEHHII